MRSKPPSSDESYDKLAGFLTEVFKIVEAATALAVQDFETRHREIEEYHLSSGVRHETRCRLLELVGTEFECNVTDLDNNGIQIVYKGHALRLRKKADGGIPKPSQSDAMRLYFEQYPLDLVWPDGTKPAPASWNLFLLWDFDYATRSLAGMDLALPNQWMMALPHPAAVDLPETEADAQAAEQLDDLELEPPDEEEEHREEKNQDDKKPDK